MGMQAVAEKGEKENKMLLENKMFGSFPKVMTASSREMEEV